MEQRTSAFEAARSLFDFVVREMVEKTIFASPAGKKKVADKMVKLMPVHKTYVEPFIGSGAVFFEKEPVEIEVINDFDPDISHAFETLKGLTDPDIAKLEGMNWTGSKEHFCKTFDSKPEDDLEKLYRFLYIANFSYGRMRSRSFNPGSEGVTAKTIGRIKKFAPRLRKVHVHNGDYQKMVEKYDGKDTLFFLDPPYPGYNVKVGESDFDEDRFYKCLKGIKGKFLVNYGDRGKFPKMAKNTKGWWVKKIKTRRSMANMRGVGGDPYLTHVLAANYTPTSKSVSGQTDFVLVDL